MAEKRRFILCDEKARRDFPPDLSQSSAHKEKKVIKTPVPKQGAKGHAHSHKAHEGENTIQKPLR